MICQSARCEELHLHAENLSRRVWELLMLLPTCPNMLQAFQNISDEQVQQIACFTFLSLLYMDTLVFSVLVEFSPKKKNVKKYVSTFRHK